ncbi:MAG: hypothetical protein OQK32_04015 [Gammaproteobacteria bacterium]|nr:hypothetical protein [Gammaproteobacteria bacterium]MCW8923683.1 hypothetical protein [Gammaproteobacteria bacterium]
MFRIVAFITIAFALGYIKGCLDAQVKEQADKVDDVVEVIETQDEIDTESHTITEQWLADDQQREVITETVEKEVQKYVPENQNIDSSCSLTVGVVCMLDARRQNLLPEIECGSLTDAEKQTASEITEAGLISADIQCADQYAELAGQCDALIDVVDAYQQRLARMRQGNDG